MDDLALLVDVELLEDRLIEQSALGGGRTQVSVVPVGSKGDRLFEIRLDHVELGGHRVESLVGVVQLAGDPRLLALHQVNRDRPGVVAVEQLAALVLQLADPTSLRFTLLGGKGSSLGKFGEEHRADAPEQLGRRLHVPVVVLDLRLDQIDEHGLLKAGVGLLLATDTDEVLVDLPAPTLVLRDDESRTARTAVDRPLQVVRVLPVLLASVALGVKHLLDALPGGCADEWPVLALVLDTLVADDALVVRVPHQAVEVRHHQRLGGSAACRRRREAPFGQLVEQPSQGPLAGGVCLEGPGHQRPSFGVDLHGPCLDAVLVFAHVQVAGRCSADGAALLGLLDAALDDLVGQVAAVELGDRAHDAVHEGARWRLVDVLGAGDERGARLADLHVDESVIEAVAGESVDLVDDDVADVVLSDVLEHPLQLWPVGCLGALAGVDELLDDDSIERLGFAATCFPLRRDGEALGFTAALGLVLRANA